MPRPNIKVDTEKLERKMREYERIIGVEVPKLIKRQARLLCVQLARQTQPFGETENAQARGEGAIDSDFGKLFFVVDEFNSRTRNATDLAGAYQFRKQNRRKTTGRFDRLTPNLKKTLNRADENTLLQALKNKVGMAKGGWAAAAAAIKADVGNALRGFPDWVKRHAKRKMGGAVDLTDLKKNPRVVLTNSVPYIDKILSQSQIRNAILYQKKRFLSFLTRGLKKEYIRRAGLNG